MVDPAQPLRASDREARTTPVASNGLRVMLRFMRNLFRGAMAKPPRAPDPVKGLRHPCEADPTRSWWVVVTLSMVLITLARKESIDNPMFGALDC
ncbi:hypothetical protein GCM10017711_40790 [Paeniglutamicibacter sulfureus]